MVMMIARRAPKPYLTVRLVMELMAADPTASQRSLGASSSGASPPSQAGPGASPTAGNNPDAQRLRELLIAATCPACETSDAPSSAPSSISLVTTQESVESDTTSSDGEASEQDFDEDFEEDRGRLFANAGVGSPAAGNPSRADSSSVSAPLLERHSGYQADHQSSRATSALDELDHPQLTGGVAALHGYVASSGDTVFLEKAYDLARNVAGSRHELGVAFNACRMALAVGYVHTSKKGSPDLARKFVLEHSLPKLAVSLQPYWSKGDQDHCTLADELAWEECMLSLLEVTSSVSLLTDKKDVFAGLDPDLAAGVAQAIGLYCSLNPDVLSQYPDLGGVCTRQHLSSVEGEKLRRSAAELKRHAFQKSPRAREHKCLVDTE